MSKLAIHGGHPVRSEPMPLRRALGDGEVAMIQDVIDYYRSRGQDPGYQSVFEERYTDAFCDMMGGGHADAVATGTAAAYVALAALELPAASEVLVSPITDPGSIGPICLLGLRPRLCDSAPGSFNIDAEQVSRRLYDNVSAVLVVHNAGHPAEINRIVEVAHARGVKVIEDCSQTHFGRIGTRPVGTFGDIALFSTMVNKAHMTGGSGGVVYCRDDDLFLKVLAYADKGKTRWQEGFDRRNGTACLFPALNLNTDEISCGIGIASLRRLPDTIRRRLSFVFDVAAGLERSKICRPHPYGPGDSPFFMPILVRTDKIGCTKIEFAQALMAELRGGGSDPLNPHYQFLVDDWSWLTPHIAKDFHTPTENARGVRNNSFNLYVNENYSEREALDCVDAILKVERYYAI